MFRTFAALSVGLSEAACPSQQIPSGKLTHLQAKGFDESSKTRNYWVHVPKNYDNSKAVPLHITYHGLNAPCTLPGGTYWNLKDEAEKRGYILVAPCGSNGDGGLGPHGIIPVTMGIAWNSGTCCGYSEHAKTDDFAFTRTIIDEVSEKLCVDPGAIWASGFSNGAMMAEVLACKLNDVFTAVASVIGVVELQPGNNGGLKTCDQAVQNSTRRTAVLNVHGDLDPMVPWQGDPIPGFPDIPNDFKAWGKRNGCSGEPTTIKEWTGGSSFIHRYSGCTNGAQVDVVKNHGASHEWPSTADFDTTDYMHEFFYNASGMQFERQIWTPTPVENLPVSDLQKSTVAV